MENQSGNTGNKQKTFRVLTLDGGGMRGLYSATLLQVLARRFDSRFHDSPPDIGAAFDLICGTSTGATLACGLAAGISLDRIRELYIEKGLEIFSSPMPSGGKLWFWVFKHRSRPAARAEILKKSLEDCFGAMTIKEVYEERDIALCIPTISAIDHRARVLKTPHNSGKHRDNNYRLVDACMASSAAPIFFPLATRVRPNGEHAVHHFVDGGLWANNPVLVGLVEALGMTDQEREIEILSVGTCDQPSGDPHLLNDTDWGLKDWRVGVRIVEMSLAAQSYGYGHMARFLAGCLKQAGRNVRIIRLEESQKSPEQYSAIGLDRADPTAIRTLLALAETDADHNHSMAMSDDPGELKMLSNIFNNLSTLKEKTNNLNSVCPEMR